jgi:hypothetical protein
MKRVLLFCGVILLGTYLPAFSQQWATSGSNIYNTNSGSVGIGTGSPAYTLDVNGSIHSNVCVFGDASTSGQIAMHVRGMATGVNGDLVVQGYNQQAWWITGASGYLYIGGNGGTEPSKGVINIDYNGNVGINTTNTSGYTFNVNGTAVFDQVTVKVFSGKPNATPWADYVFANNYRLPSIYSLADYIKANKHLPGIPTTAEVEKNGVDLGATQAKLLAKIEELTLYTIQLQKQVDSLRAENEKFADLQRQINEIRNKNSTK